MPSSSSRTSKVGFAFAATVILGGALFVFLVLVVLDAHDIRIGIVAPLSLPSTASQPTTESTTSATAAEGGPKVGGLVIVAGSKGNRKANSSSVPVKGRWVRPDLVTVKVPEVTPPAPGKKQERAATLSPRPSLPPCPLAPSSLAGRIKVAKEPLPWDRIRELNPLVLPGGHYPGPSGGGSCRPRRRVAVLVPFRRREPHLRVFLRHLHPVLQRQQLEYRIVVVSQAEEDDGSQSDWPFNRGSLFNAGFLEALKSLGGFDCFVFHDVDLLPEDDRIYYGCPESPLHMSAAIDKFSYKLPYAAIFGGAVAMTPEHFAKANGFSNQFWGWGGEDDDLFARVTAAGLEVSRYKPSAARYTMLKHKKQEPNRKRHRIMKQGRRHFKTDGLNNIRYEVLEVKEEPLYTNVTVRLFKVRPEKTAG